MKIKTISFKRQDHCVKCNADRSIELYDIYDKPINYSYFLDRLNSVSLDSFNRRELSYMQCKKCGVVYDITWENKIPEPLINKNTLFIFLNSVFKKI